MKTITLTLLTVLFIGLYSCSSDEPFDNGGNSNPPERKITKIEKLNQQGTIFSTEILTYDNQGRWIKSEETEDNEVKTKTVSYSANTITFRDNYYNEETVFELKNNLIVSRGESQDIDKYQYSNSYLSRIGTGGYADFEYSNGNLTKVVEDDGESYYNITYTDYPDKIGINIFEPDYNDGDLEVRPNNPLYQFGYLGKKSNNLIKTIKGRYYNGNTETFNYSYSFDTEGYVTEMIAQGGYPSYIKYKFYY